MDTPSIIIIVFCVLLLAFVVYVLLRALFGVGRRPRYGNIVPDYPLTRRGSSATDQFNTVRNQDIDELNEVEPPRGPAPAPVTPVDTTLGYLCGTQYFNYQLNLLFTFSFPFLHFGKWTAIPDNQREEVARLLAQASNNQDVTDGVQTNELKVCFYAFADSENFVATMIRQPRYEEVKSEAHYCELLCPEQAENFTNAGAKNSSSVVSSVNFLGKERPCIKSELTDATGKLTYQWQIPMFTEKYIYILSAISKGYATNYIPEILKLFGKC